MSHARAVAAIAVTSQNCQSFVGMVLCVLSWAVLFRPTGLGVL